MANDFDFLQREPPPFGKQRDRVEFLARILAEGVINDLWSPHILVAPLYMNDKGEEVYPLYDQNAKHMGEKWISQGHSNYEKRLNEYLNKVWHYMQPQATFLQAMGYFERLNPQNVDSFSAAQHTAYILTPKAFSLLDRPASPPNIFISYKRDQSSALALLIEARLKLVGNPNPFLDKDIVAGEQWHGRLKEAIHQCQYFICVVGAKTLDSKYVQSEIEWATNADCRIISIWHGCKMDDVQNCPDVLRERHAITVTGESAREYEAAISELLNSLGYATY